MMEVIWLITTGSLNTCNNVCANAIKIVYMGMCVCALWCAFETEVNCRQTSLP